MNDCRNNWTQSDTSSVQERFPLLHVAAMIWIAYQTTKKYCLGNLYGLLYTTMQTKKQDRKKQCNENISQAARQGLAVLMASAVVVLKHETSTLRQIHNFISIDLAWVITLGSSTALPNWVRIRWPVETPRGGNIYGSCDFLNFFFFFIQQSYSPYAWTNFRAQ